MQTGHPFSEEDVIMRILTLLSAFVLVALLGPISSHAQGIELFGGYSFVRASVTYTQTPQGTCVITGCPTTTTTRNVNFNGWNVGGAFKVLGPLALAADFSDTSGSFQGAHTHLKTYLAGPQLRFPGPISPFAHFLLGGAHESTTSSTGLVTTASPTSNAFATTLGGGLDLKVLPFISVRPIQIDYLLTHFNSKTQNQFRYSAGIVLRF
jgi:opacity protein-like surface antigen